MGVSLPPLGWWPLAVLGEAAVFIGVSGRPARRRFAAGLAAGFGQFFISLAWALQFNTAGYVVLSVVESLFFAFAALLAPAGKKWAGLSVATIPAAFTLAEYARDKWPFGGMPLGGVALGQLGGPLAITARLGGSFLVASSVFIAGAVLGSLVQRRRRVLRLKGGAAAGLGLAVLLALVLWAVVSPNGYGSGPVRLLRAALVQGGGKRGLNQLEVPPRRVFDAALRETAVVKQHVDLILWPEDVVAENGPFVGSGDERTLEALARSHDATLMAGVTEPVGQTRFRNEIVAISPAGHLVATFEKVHRVPFGEYVPFRGFFAHFANLSAVPRDAVPGTGSGLMVTPAGRFGVLVSYEVFFPGRGRSGVGAGGTVVLVPTNTSSYSNDQAPSQEIAASRLQALEQGRYVLQVAPTGYTAVIDNNGNVLQRSSLSVPAVVYSTVPELEGRTVFVRLGELPLGVICLSVLAASWALVLLNPGGVDLSGSRKPGS